VVNNEIDCPFTGRGSVKTKGAIVTVEKSSGQHPQQGFVVGSGEDVVVVVVVVVVPEGAGVVVVVVGGTNDTLIP
jgi:hypothetical protein